MASTMDAEIGKVRRLLGDRKLSETFVPGATLEELMFDAMDEIAREAGAGDIIQTGFATVSSTDTSVTVSATYPAMRHLKHLVRESDGFPLQKTSHEAILASRAFGGSQFGPPQEYAIVPLTDEGVELACHPLPQTAETLTAVWEPVPSTVTRLAGSIYLSPTGLIALRNRVAARGLESLSQERLAALGRGQKYIDTLHGIAERAIVDEWARMHAGETQDFIVRARRS